MVAEKRLGNHEIPYIRRHTGNRHLDNNNHARGNPSVEQGPARGIPGAPAFQCTLTRCPRQQQQAKHRCCHSTRLLARSRPPSRARSLSSLYPPPPSISSPPPTATTSLSCFRARNNLRRRTSRRHPSAFLSLRRLLAAPRNPPLLLVPAPLPQQLRARAVTDLVLLSFTALAAPPTLLTTLAHPPYLHYHPIISPTFSHVFRGHPVAAR